MFQLILLGQLLPQGYIYTIDPPSIFATVLDSAHLCNRLQILALKYLHTRELALFKNLRMVAFNDYEDKKAIPLIQKSIQMPVVSKSDLFKGPDGTYLPPDEAKGHALVLHNNSDAFGRNIETEGMNIKDNWAGSMDGVIGNYSDAACVLKSDRPDLLDYII